jgi:uncharacterized membrane protein YqgA involved in biofilm formation
MSLLAGLLATLITDPTTDPHILAVTGIGGLMILGLGFNLLEITRIQVASFLPALLIGPAAVALARFIWAG